MAITLAGGALTLQFQDAPIQIVTLDGERWVHGPDIGRALGYRHPRSAIYKLFNRNQDEFSPAMTMVVQVQDLRSQVGYADPPLRSQIGDGAESADAEAGDAADDAGFDQAREARLFSARGAHLLAMFARTPVAKQFRHWVLDVLEGACAGGRHDKLPLGQELSLIRLSVTLMDKVARCENRDMAEELFRRLMRVNRAMGMQTLPFVDLAVACRQRPLPLADNDDERSTH